MRWKFKLVNQVIQLSVYFSIFVNVELMNLIFNENPQERNQKRKGKGARATRAVGGESLALSSQIPFGSRAGGRKAQRMRYWAALFVSSSASLEDFALHDKNASFSNQKIKLQNK